MNERFRELAFQAMSINQKVSDDAFFVEVSKLKEFEKFAQLIVRECSKVNNQFIGRRIGEIDLDMVYKEHFGVRE